MTGPELCPKCKGLHYRNSPCIVRVTKSTAARKDVHRSNKGGAPDCAMVEQQGGGRRPSIPTVAGTQALPVDTNSTVAENGVDSFPSQPYVSPTFAGTVGNKDRKPIQKRGRGRPKSITDMAAYKRAKQREYRAKWKGRE